MQHSANALNMDFLTAGGEMGERIRNFDWNDTPIGPPESWSISLQTTVGIMLANRLPMLLWWGPDYICIYNDAYISILGSKHPWGLGKPVRECWSEIWHILQPLIDTPFNGGPGTWMDDISLELKRHGFFEETHFTIAYSPVPDELAPNRIGGVLATVTEITDKVIGERRVIVLRDVSSHSTEAKTPGEACKRAAATISNHTKDIPFMMIYLVDEQGKKGILQGAAGIKTGEPISPIEIKLEDSNSYQLPYERVFRTGKMEIVDKLSEKLKSHILPSLTNLAPNFS